MAHSGYLGGDVSTAERYRLRDKYITPRANVSVDGGLENQCRCGGTVYVEWRGRFYCTRCARWLKELKAE